MGSFRPIMDSWILGRPKVKYHGAYPAGFLERARWLLPVTPADSVLHVCGGKVREYSSPDRGVKAGVALRGFYLLDKTVDLDVTLDPDFLVDVSQKNWPEQVAEQHFKATGAGWPQWRGILIDRPYTPEDADHYAPGADALPTPKVLLEGARALLADGGRVGMLDYIWPRPPEGLFPVAKIGVTCGYSNRERCFSVFERRIR